MATFAQVGVAQVSQNLDRFLCPQDFNLFEYSFVSLSHNLFRFSCLSWLCCHAWGQASSGCSCAQLERGAGHVPLPRPSRSRRAL